MRHWLYKLLCKDEVHPKSHKNPLGVALTIRSERGRVDSLKGHYTQKSIGLLQKLWYQNSTQFQPQYLTYYVVISLYIYVLCIISGTSDLL